jgi:hypothetical protein
LIRGSGKTEKSELALYGFDFGVESTPFEFSLSPWGFIGWEFGGGHGGDPTFGRVFDNPCVQA